MGKKQLHKRLSDEQAKTILENYRQGEIELKPALEKMQIKRARFFRLLAKYKKEGDNFTLQYKREKTTRSIGDKAEAEITKELEREKELIENKNNAISGYNYSFIRDTLSDNYGIKVSVPTIIDRAKSQGFYREKKKRKIHDRVVLTNFVGELCQHDSSCHQFSPYIPKKFYLITTLDDHSRLILFADLFEKETTWNHISSLRRVFLEHGCPLKYYVDQHSIFRYIKERDKNSIWRNFYKFTDDINPQFKQVLSDCNTDLTYALSPQAKGKVERPYRWIQDRLVRIAARDKIDNIEDLRKVLKELIHKYNCHWVHSTTKEIPIIRFEKALNDKRHLFSSFKLERGQELNDIFCLRAQRIVNPYRKISLEGAEIAVPNGNPRDRVDIKIAPEVEKNYTELRFWRENEFLGNQKVGLNDLKVVQF